jgi:hypothetical protein
MALSPSRAVVGIARSQPPNLNLVWRQTMEPRDKRSTGTVRVDLRREVAPVPWECQGPLVRLVVNNLAQHCHPSALGPRVKESVPPRTTESWAMLAETHVLASPAARVGQVPALVLEGPSGVISQRGAALVQAH